MKDQDKSNEQLMRGGDNQEDEAAGAGSVEDMADGRAFKQTEQEMWENFQLMTETIEDVFWISSPGFDEIFYLSPGYEKIWGRSRQDLYRSPEALIETIHPDDRERFWAEIKKHSEGIATDFEYRIMRPDGSIRWIHNRAFPRRDKDGRLVKVVGTATDITERKQAEEEIHRYRCHLEELIKERTDRLIKTNEQLQVEILDRYRAEDTSRLAYAELNQIFDGAAEGICLIDIDYEFVRVNRAFCTLTGFSKDELIGCRCSEIFHTSTCGSLGCPLVRILNGEEFVEIEKELRRKDGSRVPCLMAVSPFRGVQGELRGIVSFIRDISDRKRAEELLRESEAKYSALVEQAQDGVAIVQDGVFKFVNSSALSMGGYSYDEMLGKPFLDFITSEARQMASWLSDRLLCGTKIPPLFEVKFICKDGTIKYGEVSSSIIQYEGRPAIMVIVRDVTSRKRLEEEKEKIRSQLLHAQKMEAIGLLAGGVAHDFNNLLTMIQGHATLALLEISEDDPVAMDLKEIRLAAGRAANLTRQLLLFSRKQPAEPVCLNLNQTIDELLKMIYRVIGEDIKIRLELEPNLWTTLADEGNIEQVIMNLVINARDAMPRGGELTIRTENLILDEKQAACLPEARPGQFVRLSITDTGCGMSSEVMSRIFEPFYTTKEFGKGSGLGLSVVYGIIKQHEGWINVSSLPGQGATFAICLPASLMRPEKKVDEAISVRKFQGQGERVLLVEDDGGVRKLTATMLQQNGYLVYTAASSREALSIFAQERGNFDLLLSDVILPDQSAIELADQLLLLRPELQILLISGYPDKQAQWPTIRERGFRLLHKPVSLLTLLKSLRELLEKSRGEKPGGHWA